MNDLLTIEKKGICKKSRYLTINRSQPIYHSPKQPTPIQITTDYKHESDITKRGFYMKFN